MFSSAIERLNERRHAAVDTDMDTGFSLIELMVVLLILAILLAIATPTFLGVSAGANDEAAQSNLTTGLTTAKAAETQNKQSYNIAGGGIVNITAVTLHDSEPNITFDAGAVAAIGQVSVYVSSDGKGIVLASWSKPGTCWYTADNIATVVDTNPVTPYAGGGAPSTAAGKYYGKATTTQANCNAAAALPVATGWGSNFGNA